MNKSESAMARKLISLMSGLMFDMDTSLAKTRIEVRVEAIRARMYDAGVFTCPIGAEHFVLIDPAREAHHWAVPWAYDLEANRLWTSDSVPRFATREKAEAYAAEKQRIAREFGGAGGATIRFVPVIHRGPLPEPKPERPLYSKEDE